MPSLFSTTPNDVIKRLKSSVEKVKWESCHLTEFKNSTKILPKDSQENIAEQGDGKMESAARNVEEGKQSKSPAPQSDAILEMMVHMNVQPQ